GRISAAATCWEPDHGLSESPLDLFNGLRARAPNARLPQTAALARRANGISSREYPSFSNDRTSAGCLRRTVIFVGVAPTMTPFTRTVAPAGSEVTSTCWVTLPRRSGAR